MGHDKKAAAPFLVRHFQLQRDLLDDGFHAFNDNRAALSRFTAEAITTNQTVVDLLNEFVQSKGANSSQWFEGGCIHHILFGPEVCFCLPPATVF